MKLFTAALLATVFGVTATSANAQTSVDAGVDASAAGSVTAGTNDTSAGADAAAGANAGVSATTATGGDSDGSTGSYADLSASLSSSTNADFTTMSNVSDINIVLISTLGAEASGDAWAQLRSSNSANVERLHSSIESNSALNARLTAELSAAGDFTLDDVVAISTSADGALTVYVDDTN